MVYTYWNAWNRGCCKRLNHTLNFAATLCFCDSVPPLALRVGLSNFWASSPIEAPKSCGSAQSHEANSCNKSAWSRSLFFSRNPFVSYTTCNQDLNYWSAWKICARKIVQSWVCISTLWTQISTRLSEVENQRGDDCRKHSLRNYNTKLKSSMRWNGIAIWIPLQHSGKL